MDRIALPEYRKFCLADVPIYPDRIALPKFKKSFTNFIDKMDCHCIGLFRLIATAENADPKLFVNSKTFRKCFEVC